MLTTGLVIEGTLSFWIRVESSFSTTVIPPFPLLSLPFPPFPPPTPLKPPKTLERTALFVFLTGSGLLMGKSSSSDKETVDLRGIGTVFPDFETLEIEDVLGSLFLALEGDE